MLIILVVLTSYVNIGTKSEHSFKIFVIFIFQELFYIQFYVLNVYNILYYFSNIPRCNKSTVWIRQVWLGGILLDVSWNVFFIYFRLIKREHFCICSNEKYNLYLLISYECAILFSNKNYACWPLFGGNHSFKTLRY